MLCLGSAKLAGAFFLSPGSSLFCSISPLFICCCCHFGHHSDATVSSPWVKLIRCQNHLHLKGSNCLLQQQFIQLLVTLKGCPYLTLLIKHNPIPLRSLLSDTGILSIHLHGYTKPQHPNLQLKLVSTVWVRSPIYCTILKIPSSLLSC